MKYILGFYSSVREKADGPVDDDNDEDDGDGDGDAVCNS